MNKMQTRKDFIKCIIAELILVTFIFSGPDLGNLAYAELVFGEGDGNNVIPASPKEWVRIAEPRITVLPPKPSSSQIEIQPSGVFGGVTRPLGEGSLPIGPYQPDSYLNQDVPALDSLSLDSLPKEEILENLRHAAIDTLIKVALYGGIPSVRIAAIGLLGQAKDPRAVEPLIKVLDDKDASIRLATVWALGQAKDPRAVLPLIKTVISDKDILVRAVAIWALVEIVRPVVEPLVKALDGVRTFLSQANNRSQ